MIYKLIMLSEKQQKWGTWLSAKNLTHSKSMRILDYIKCCYSKTAFWKKNWNLACRVILSIYTFYVIFKQIWAWHRSRPSYLNHDLNESAVNICFVEVLKIFVICLVENIVSQIIFVEKKILWKYKQATLQFPCNHCMICDNDFTQESNTHTIICPRHCKNYAWGIATFPHLLLYS